MATLPDVIPTRSSSTVGLCHTFSIYRDGQTMYTDYALPRDLKPYMPRNPDETVLVHGYSDKGALVFVRRLFYEQRGLEG